MNDDGREPALPQRGWSADVHRRLIDLLQSPPSPLPPVAVFDWDDTTICGDISLTLLRWCDARQQTRWHDTYFELLEAHGRDVAYPQIARWFAGHTESSFARLAREVVDDALERGIVTWRSEILDLIGAMQAGGWRLWVVSASPAPIVTEMARRIGIPADRVLAMSLELGGDGRYTDTVVRPATYAEGKRLAIEQHVRQVPALVVGDSRSDAPMMGMAHHALLLHGHDLDLLAEARARGWWVQEGWKHTPAEPGVRVSDV